ncbi:MAG: uncharacterized protein A8A55_3219 [Amphiamblys sp. WSBS2006]|nr:MAG: uncharacterized protein A8A55_3219 [Amphiamblys sp. WSBS2006]
MRSYSEQNDGYAWILNLVDTNTKLVMVGVLKTQGWRELAKLFGSPRLLHTNNETKFKNETVTGLCASYGTRQIHGKAQRPQSQGQIERANQTLKRKLRAAVTITAALERWIDCLHGAVAGYNRCMQKTTGARPL